MEDSGMPRDIQGCSRKGRRIYIYIYIYIYIHIYERMIEMVKIKKECLMVVFIDMEKAHSKFGLKEMVNLIWLREVSGNGMVNIGINVDGEGCKKYICEIIQEGSRGAWKYGFNDTEREKGYVRMKESPRNESIAD